MKKNNRKEGGGKMGKKQGGPIKGLVVELLCKINNRRNKKYGGVTGRGGSDQKRLGGSSERGTGST